MSQREPAEPVNVRLTPEMAAAAGRISDGQNKTLGQWAREVLSKEIALREGVCPTCGQHRSREGGKAPPAPG
jgi:hypothetical protein